MTERAGGSDLSMTETKAYNPKPPNRSSFNAEEWELEGFKWFSSATDGDLALALARTGTPHARCIPLCVKIVCILRLRSGGCTLTLTVSRSLATASGATLYLHPAQHPECHYIRR